MGLNVIEICLQWMERVYKLLPQERYAAQQEAKKRRDPNLADSKVYEIATQIIEETKRNLQHKAFQLGKTEDDRKCIKYALAKPLGRLCIPWYLKTSLEKIIKGEAEPEEPKVEENGSETEEFNELG